jgi:hypothetical protein
MTERDMGTKALGAVLEIKDAEKGDVEAVVATLDVVDKDREVIRSGAIKSGAKVKLSEWGHNSVPFMGSAPPVGKGVVLVEGNRVVFRGKFFLTTARGAEAFRTLKEMGPDQEWSFGYRVLESQDPDAAWRGKGAMRVLTKLEPFEVSPVTIAAGVGTRTVAVKCDACAAKDAADEAADTTEKGSPDQAAAAALATAQALDGEAAAAAAVMATKQAAELQAVAAQEFERFQRTFQRFGT